MSRNKIQMYGKFAAKEKDKDQLQKEEQEREQQRLQNKSPKINIAKNMRPFNHRLDRYCAQSVLNRIEILDCSTLAVIDIIQTSHPAEIQCFDIAEISKDIVSYSTLSIEGIGEVSKHLVVCGLKDTSYLNGIDEKVTQELRDKCGRSDEGTTQPMQVLKWVEYWRCDPKDLIIGSFLNTVSLSPHGDALALGGNEFFSLWTRDSSMSTHSYSVYLYYAKQIPKNIYAQCLEEKDVLQVIQSEFSADARTIITLEESNDTKAQSLKVWYNVKMRSIEEPRIKKAFISRNPNREPEKGEVFRRKIAITDLEYLDYFEIPISSRNGRFVQFRTLNWPQSFYADEQVIPIALLAFTDKGQAQLWVENLNFSPSYDKQDPNDDYEVLTFSCVHVFGSSRPGQQLHFDAQLLQQSSFLNSACFTESDIDGRSGILDPSGEDYIQLAKTVVHDKMFDNMLLPQHKGSTSKDFIIVLDRNRVEVYSVLGLRNFPSRAIEVILEGKSSLAPPSAQNDVFLNMQSLIACCSNSLCDSNDLQDCLSLVCINQQQQFLKLTKSSEEDSAWKVDAIKVKDAHQSQRSYINQAVPAPDIPAVAILQNHNSILFYFEARSAKTIRNQQILHDDFKFMGQYLSQNGGKIEQLRWVPGLLQLLVLRDDGKLSLVSSKTTDAILSSVASNGDYIDISALHHQKLENQASVEIFKVVLDDLLSGMKPSGAIIDFGVLGLRFLLCDVDSKVVKYKVNVVVMTTDNLHFYEFVISYGAKTNESENIKIQTTNLCSKAIGEGLRIHEILCSLAVPKVNEKAFEPSNPKLKCVLLVVNAQCLFEVAFIEVTRDSFSILWQKLLPGQTAPRGVSSSVQIHGQGGQQRPITGAQAAIQQPNPLDYEVSARISHKYATILTRSVGKNWYNLYIYEHQMLDRYIGFLNLLDFIDFEPHDSSVLLKDGFALDYALIQAEGSETILLTCVDRLFVICYNQQQQYWQCLRHARSITGRDIRTIKTVRVVPTHQDNILLVYNNCELASLNCCLQVYGADIEEELEANENGGDTQPKRPMTESMAHLGFSLQRSSPIYSLSVLRQLYINGKIEFIMKMLIQMNGILKQELQDFDKNQQMGAGLKISRILNLTLQALVTEVNVFVEAQVVQQDLVAAAEAEASNAAKAVTVQKDTHGGLFGSDDDESSGMEDFDNPPPAPTVKEVAKKEEVKEVEKDRKIEQQFLEIYMDLLTSINKLEDSFGGKDLLDFILIFKDIYAKDFFSDDAAATLLREIYLETQYANKETLKELQMNSKKIEETEVVKRLQDHEIYAQMYGEKDDAFESQTYQNKGQGNVSALKQWDSRKCALALFTVNQDVVLEELQTRFDLESNCSWQMVKRLCLPVWIKDDYKLRMMVEWIAKAAYRIAGEEQMKSTGVGTAPISKAEATSLWYLLMNKKSMLISLYEKEKGSGGDKVAAMLSNDFSVERWKKAALKNAGVLRSKQRYLLCVTFLILGNDVLAALQVMKQNLSDPIMAILACRMLLLQKPGDTRISDALHQLYEEFFVTRGKQFDDVYLQSIGLWNQGKVVEAVNVLQKEDHIQTSTPNTSTNYLFEVQNGFQIKDQDGKKIEKDKYVPIINQEIGYELNKMVLKLKKAPKVTHALKEDAGSTGYGADAGDIFADFLGGPAAKTETKKEEPKAEKPKLLVQGSKLLNQSLYQCYLKQDILQAIFLLRESREDINPNDQSQMRYILLICTQIVKDQVQELYDESNFSDETTTLSEQIDYLLCFALDIKSESAPKELEEQQQQLRIQKRYMQRVIEEQILLVFEKAQSAGTKSTSNSTLLRYELELRLEAQQRQVVAPGIRLPQDYCSMNKMMSRMEAETFKFVDFIQPITENPFLENTAKRFQMKTLSAMRTIICDLEHHLECLIIFDHFEEKDWLAIMKTQSNEAENLDASEIEFFLKDVTGQTKEDTKKKEEPKKQSQFDDMFGQDSSSDEGSLDFDNFEAPKPAQKDAENDGMAPNKKPELSEEDVQSFKLVDALSYCERSLQRLSSKLKQSVYMYLYLVILAVQTQKFYIVKDLLSKDDLQATLSIDTKQVEAFKTEFKQIKEQALQVLSLRQSDRNGQAQQIQNQVHNSIKDLHSAVTAVYHKVNFQQMKMHIQRIRRTVDKRIGQIESVQKENYGESESEHEVDNVGINQELWEKDMIMAEKDVGDVASTQQDESQSETRLFGLLVKHNHINHEVYEFLRIWLQLISVSKTNEAILNSWVSSDRSIMRSNPSQTILYRLCDKTQAESINESLWSCKQQQQIEQLIESIYNPHHNNQRVIANLQRMNKRLEDQCTLVFEHQLNVLQRKYLTHCIIQQDCLFSHFMKYFFKNKEKMERFWKGLSVQKSFGKSLSHQFLTLLGRSNTMEQEEYETKDQLFYKKGGYDIKNMQSQGKQSATQAITQELLDTGIELFKQGGEQISDFAFDNTSNSDNIALGLMTSGIREIPVVNTLLFRNRIEKGLQLIDTENLKWEECLHRYDQLTKICDYSDIIKDKDNSIITAIDSLYCHKTINYRSKPLQKQGLKYVSNIQLPPAKWNGSNSDSYLQQTSKLEITHEDYTYPLESHPHLPLYMSGNRRGIICTWRFGREQDKSLNQFMPEIDPRQADPRRACVKKIMFNNYGDKIMSNNMEGSFSIYQIDCHSKHMRKTPIFSLYENMDCRVNDFDLVNQDNIICTISQKQKTIKIYDTLLPYCLGKNTEVMSVKLPSSTNAGNIILCNQKKQTILTFNGRTGAMTELDLRMNLQQINQYQLSESHEITAAMLNDRQDTLVTGYKDGFIKIHSLNKYYENNDQKQLQLREKIDAFHFDFRSKKGPVLRIKQSKKGGLFASSQSGILKLIRTSI